MKKTLLSVFAGMIVIGSAFAAPTPEDRKKLCEKHPDKYVWVEKDQFCAPRYPCASENTDIRNAYCIDIFDSTQKSVMQNVIVRDKLLKRALGAHNIVKVEHGFDDCVLRESWQLGGFYCHSHPVLLVSYDGKYVEIPYGNPENLTASGAACIIYGGEFMRGNYEDYENHRMPCTYVASSDICRELASFVSDLDGKIMKYTWEESSPPICWIEGTNGNDESADWGG